MKYYNDPKWLAAHTAQRKRLQIDYAQALAALAAAKAHHAKVKVEMTAFKNGPQPTDDVTT